LSRLLRYDSSPRLPILMYHGISDSKGTKHPYFETNTSPRLFAEQMKFLKQNGNAATDLVGALASLEAGHQGRKQVVITFDDAYQDFYTSAFPVLMEYGFCATLFAVTGWTCTERISGAGTTYMTWNEIREVHAHGIRIGSHTVTHPELRRLSAEQICIELGNSKQVMEDNLGAPIRSFSYPYAFPEQDDKFVHFMKQTLLGCGYENGVSTILGTVTPQHDRFFLPRLPVNCYDDLRFFQAKLEGGYDWLHAPQRLYKRFLKRSNAASKVLNASAYSH